MEHYFTNNESLKSDFRSVKYVYKDTPFVFTSDLGVFSKDKIDYGSKSLLEKVLEIESTGKKNTRCWMWLWFYRNSFV